ncbi:hypothetical protein CAPTEDRAFT_218557 [Capitella teleta]|uniref:CARD domain-containing protein n=1 Tax=Capitella teleta TaxID=283909 RepID=R7V609_CAPTE|nr:hypothetical protein CAPTEDRAFT_218557 [Capitella teleta]|eukprot:ELU13922.1 hypothetical protein CAPTEDRAFT_218557 [Capitella teleta]
MGSQCCFITALDWLSVLLAACPQVQNKSSTEHHHQFPKATFKMNIVRDFRIVRLIAALEQDIKNAEELLDYIDGELSHCRDEEKESAFRRMRPIVLQALDQKEFMRDKLKADLEELKDMFCTTTRSTR